MPSNDIAVDRSNTPPAPITSSGVIVVADTHDLSPDKFCEVMLWFSSDDYLHGVELWWLDRKPEEFPPPEIFDSPRFCGR